MREVFTPQSYALAMKILNEELAAEGQPQNDPERSRLVEMEMYRKDGSILPVEIHYKLLRDQQKRPAGVLAVARKTEHRKAGTNPGKPDSPD
jgi:PAS domain S-box-containing protein